MCIAVPAKVIKIYKYEALVDFKGVKMKANIGLVNNLSIGDYILLHGGCAIERIDEVEANKTLELFENILTNGQEI
ncbi:HypC/HybG/HupF family hydrogenase formation chaperone [Dethiothermospora halolimnae]|uniref:HypC/HybG/HupF family hydrogenase formation chaperone n=1 Tax=Dethiothermospora halolimnae TaxID=3114390 RepID=UPI003CCBC139